MSALYILHRVLTSKEKSLAALNMNYKCVCGLAHVRRFRNYCTNDSTFGLQVLSAA